MSSTDRVLLVDDSDELLEATRELLEAIGHTVTSAASAAEALAAFEAAGVAGFDVLVSDVFMPGASGLELAESLLVRDADLAVLLASSRGGEPELRRRVAAGDVGFLAKPFSPAELGSALDDAKRRAAGRSRARRRTEVAPPPAPRRRESSRRSWRSAVAPAWQLAAVVVLVLGLGTLLPDTERGAPPLPAPGLEVIRRTTTISPLVPVGTVDEVPGELGWRPVAGSHAYAVSLRGVDGTPLWQARVRGARAPLPEQVVSDLRRAVTYYWSVEALDADDDRLAGSGPVRFSIELARRPRLSEPLEDG